MKTCDMCEEKYTGQGEAFGDDVVCDACADQLFDDSHATVKERVQLENSVAGDGYGDAQ